MIVIDDINGDKGAFVVCDGEVCEVMEVETRINCGPSNVSIHSKPFLSSANCCGGVIILRSGEINGTDKSGSAVAKPNKSEN